MADFQKKVFLSLLSDQSEGQISNQIRKLNVEEERQALEDIYKQFELNPNHFRKRTSRHFETFNRAIEKFNSDEPLSLMHFAVLIGTIRIHSVVEDWNKLLDERSKIFEPRETFLNVLNSMVIKKEFYINEKNELSVKTNEGREFSLSQLSSGEKQLLIILGEALLQERQPWIYIADEPELSLHVSWQESLVRNLTAINPNAQIIFATHSPDIVSTYGDSVFDMEKAFV